MSSVSPVLVGRGRELDRLITAFGDRPGAVLVGGEAGVGKTRLISEFTGRIADRARVLVGGCLELGSEGLPFAPFTAALRGLVRELGAAEVAALLPGHTGTGLARLLPEFGEPDTRGTDGEIRARLFELVLTLLERLAEQTPVVLIIEDAHWADRSTRDLLSFLIRNLGAGLLIVVTYRLDELHRGHPLRPLLAELDRVERVRRFDLPRLGRREVAELVRSIIGHDPAPRLLDEVYERSEGNPLFVEALLTRDGELSANLPESLRDLLLAGVQRLPEETQDVLRAASGTGYVEHRLLAAVTGLDEAALSRALRPAVTANVLTVAGDGYTFRHALIREAVHDDLLPGEHTRLHARYAESLEADPGLVSPDRSAAELAQHWQWSHNAPAALVSARRAAREAYRAAAYAEALQLLSRVLELWDQVPDAEERLGEDHLAVLELAATAADLCGENDRGIKLATAALREIGDDDPVRRAALLEQRGRLALFLRRDAGIADLAEAVELLPADPPTRDRARALATMSHLFVKIENRQADAQRAAEEAITMARAVDDPVAEANGLLTLNVMNLDRDADVLLAELAEAKKVAETADSFQPLLRVALNTSHILEGAGRHEQAAKVARQGLVRAAEHGVGRSSGSILAINQAEPLSSLGRWDEALEVIDRAMEQDPLPNHAAGLRQLAGEIAVARGDLAAAATYLEQAAAAIPLNLTVRAEDYFAIVRLEAELRLAEGRPEQLLTVIEPVLEHRRMVDDARYAWPVLVLGALACAKLGGGTPKTLERIEERAGRLATVGPVHIAHRATFQAAAALAHGTLDQAAWEAAAAAWQALGNRYRQARALLPAAEAAATAGDREAAAVHLRTAVELADRLGARPLRARLDDLARRARLGETPARGELGLTPRELEVLRLVAEGRSNREIAEELYISAKTASVHVSNIIAKLGVSSRGEAAATAHRLSLFAPS